MARSDDSLAVEIVQAVAEEDDAYTTELPPLVRTIDVKAMAQVLESASTPLVFRFQYAGYSIAVDGQRNVAVE